MKLTWWDAHTSKVAHRNRLWAQSDRGWLFRDGDGSSLGHYLEYGPDYRTDDTSAEPGTVHAVVCGEERCRASRWCVTVEEARRWIEGQCGLGPCVVNPKSRATDAQRQHAEAAAKGNPTCTCGWYKLTDKRRATSLHTSDCALRARKSA